MRFLAKVSLLAAGSAWFAAAGTITGKVTDSDGVALAKAAVQAKSTTGAMFSTQSAADGRYSLAQLPAGSYDLLVLVPGMLPYEQKNITVGASQSIALDVRVQDLATLNTLGDGREFLADLTSRHKTPSGPTPRTANGKPDFSGVWRGSMPGATSTPELLPAALEILKQRQETHLRDFPMGHCLPTGVTLFGTFLPYRIIQTPQMIVMISESDTPGYRQIFLDGRSHPKNAEPTWMGHSVGKWEGDTLVVDTANLNDKNWLDLEGHPQSERMHIVERYRRPDVGHLEIEFTIDDPGSYAKPWSTKKVSDLAPQEEVGEYICNENNQDVAHLVGN